MTPGKVKAFLLIATCLVAALPFIRKKTKVILNVSKKIDSKNETSRNKGVKSRILSEQERDAYIEELEQFNDDSISTYFMPEMDIDSNSEKYAMATKRISRAIEGPFKSADSFFKEARAILLARENEQEEATKKKSRGRSA